MKIFFINNVLYYYLILFFCIGVNTAYSTDDKHTITVLGTGYVGLVTGTGLATIGNHVICADINQAKIESLKKNIVPFFEPELQELVMNAVKNNYLSFTTNVADAIVQSDILFIAVDTPSAEDGHADLTALYKVIDSIAKNINSYKIIVIKSTVPLTTNKLMEKYLLSKGIDHALFDIVSNPEFLREGSAVYDFFNPDRIIIGSNNKASSNHIARLYAPLKNGTIPVIITDTTSAEMVKYASNAFLASKISFINEIANLCDIVKADIVTVADGMGLDARITRHFLMPGPGFGGSCFPKDSRELLSTASDYNVSLEVVKGSLIANERQQHIAIEKLKKLLGPDLQNKTICILGLSFKANTDDIRYSPAIKTIELLQKESAIINAYDPAAIGNMTKLFPTVNYCPNADEAMKNSDAIILLTEWNEFKDIDWQTVHAKVNQPYIIDMRNILDPVTCQKQGFIYEGIGRSYFNTEHR
jgi:UDPglucose 6-dehydrogenase